MSDPISVSQSGLSLADRYGNTVLYSVIACVVLAALCLLGEGLWLYFHPSFY